MMADQGKAGAGKSLLFRCPHCGNSYRAPKEALGKTFKCKKCRGAIQISGVIPAAQSETAAVRSATSSEEKASSGKIAIWVAVGFVGVVAAAVELLVALPATQRDVFVRGAAGCTIIAGIMFALGLAGGWGLKKLGVPWLSLCGHLAWVVATTVLLLPFVIPGYWFPYAPTTTIDAVAGSSMGVTVAILLKYALLVTAALMIGIALCARSSPLRPALTASLTWIGKLVWLPVQVVLFLRSAPRVCWIRRRYGPKADRLQRRIDKQSLELGRTAETVLPKHYEQLPDSVQKALERVVSDAESIQAWRTEKGLDQDRGLMQAIDAAAGAMGRRASKDEREELQRLSGEYDSAVVRVALALLATPSDTLDGTGLSVKVKEILDARQMGKLCETAERELSEADELPDSIRSARDALSAARERLDTWRRGHGLEKGTGFKDAISAAATALRHAKLTAEERAEVEALESRCESTMRSLALTLLAASEELLRQYGLQQKQQEVCEHRNVLELARAGEGVLTEETPDLPDPVAAALADVRAESAALNDRRRELGLEEETSGAKAVWMSAAAAVRKLNLPPEQKAQLEALTVRYERALQRLGIALATSPESFLDAAGLIPRWRKLRDSKEMLSLGRTSEGVLAKHLGELPADINECREAACAAAEQLRLRREELGQEESRGIAQAVGAATAKLRKGLTEERKKELKALEAECDAASRALGVAIVNADEPWPCSTDLNSAIEKLRTSKRVVQLGTEAATSLREKGDQLPPAVGQALDDVLNIQNALNECREKLGPEPSHRVTMALGAAAKKIRRRKLTAKEKTELEAMQSAHTEVQRELGHAFADASDSTASETGLASEVAELQSLKEELTATRQAHEGAAHRWISFSSLPFRRQYYLTATAVALLLAVLVGVGAFNPSGLAATRDHVFRNEGLQETLLALAPDGCGPIWIEPKIELTIDGESTVDVGGVITLSAKVRTTGFPEDELKLTWKQESGPGQLDEPDDDGRSVDFVAPMELEESEETTVTLVATRPAVTTEEPTSWLTWVPAPSLVDPAGASVSEEATRSLTMRVPPPPPPPIAAWPLMPEGAQLCWRKTGEDDEAARLGMFQTFGDPPRPFFREFGAPRVEPVEADAIELIQPSTSGVTNLSDSQIWLGQCLLKIIPRCSVPDGRCTTAPDENGRAKVSIGLTKLAGAKELHVVRVVFDEDSLLLQQENLGTVKVVDPLETDTVVKVPETVDLREGDCVFPVTNEERVPQIVFEGVADREGTKPPEDDSLAGLAEKQKLKIEEQIWSSLQSLGIAVLQDQPGDGEALLQLVAEAEPPSEVEKALRVDFSLQDGRQRIRVAKLQVPIEKPGKTDFPTYLVSGRPASAELRDGTRRVVWLDEVAFHNSDPQQVPQGNESIPLGDLLDRRSEFLPANSTLNRRPLSLKYEDVLPGSVEWLDDESELEEEMPFAALCAWKMIRSLCVPTVPLYASPDDQQQALAWCGSIAPKDQSLIRAILPNGTSERSLVHLEDLGPWPKNPKARIVQIAAGAAGGPLAGGRAMLGMPLKQRPYVVFLDEFPREYQEERASARLQIGTLDVRAEYRNRTQAPLHTWGRILNDRMRAYLAAAGIDTASESAIRELQKRGYQGSLAQGNVTQLVSSLGTLGGQVTHVVFTKLVPSPVSYGASATVEMYDITGGVKTSSGFPTRPREITISDLFPDDRVYKDVPFLLAGQTDHDSIRALRHHNQPMAGQVLDLTTDPILIRVLDQHSYLSIHEKHLRLLETWWTGDWRSTKKVDAYWPLIQRFALDVALEVAPKGIRIPPGTEAQIAQGRLTVDLGTDDGTDAKDRFYAVRYPMVDPVPGPNDTDVHGGLRGRRTVLEQQLRKAEHKEATLGQVHVVAARAHECDVEIPPDVKLLPGDILYPCNPPRVHIAMYPLRAAGSLGNATVLDKSEQIAGDLQQELRRFGVPMLANLDLIRQIYGAFRDAGVDARTLAQEKPIGATHAIIGQLDEPPTPRMNYYLLSLSLVDLATGKPLTPSSTQYVTKNLGQDWSQNTRKK